MQHLFTTALAALDHNVIFGALIGIECLFLMSRVPLRRVFIFWGMLLPTLIAAGLLDKVMGGALRPVHAAFLAPFLELLMAAAGAGALVAIYQRISSIDTGHDAELLLFASIAALLVALPRLNGGNTGPSAIIGSAAAMWLGYGIGLVCFASLGGRLRKIITGGRFAGPILFLWTFAIVALAVGAVTGLRFGHHP